MMEKSMEERFNDLNKVIGNTPLLELSFLYRDSQELFMLKPSTTV